MTTKKTAPATTSGIPTAKGHFPPGTPAHVCITHNRACKVARLVTAALIDHYDAHITDDELDLVADRAGINRPGSDDTRDAVRAGLEEPFTDNDFPDEEIAEAVVDAAERGRPFRFRESGENPRTVLLIALPLSE